MRRIALGLAFSAVALTATAQDRPPPGCRWQSYKGEETLACKDGKGHWRRSGDDEIVGTYPLPKPKPKPAPVARASTSGQPTAPVAAELAPPPPPPPPAAAEETPQTPDAAAAAGAEAAPAPAAQPVPAKPEPWWKAFFGGLWKAILGFLKAVGLVR